MHGSVASRYPILIGFEIQLNICLWRSWITHKTPTLEIVGSNPIRQAKNSTSFDLSNFLSIAKAMAYHRALACISSPKVYIINRRLYYFRNDDIQDCVLMICNASH